MSFWKEPLKSLSLRLAFIESPSFLVNCHVACRIARPNDDCQDSLFSKDANWPWRLGNFIKRSPTKTLPICGPANNGHKILVSIDFQSIMSIANPLHLH